MNDNDEKYEPETCHGCKEEMEEYCARFTGDRPRSWHADCWAKENPKWGMSFDELIDDIKTESRKALKAIRSLTPKGSGKTMKSKSLETVYAVKEIIEKLSEYWPLTLRQIYYQLVAALLIENNLLQYQRLSRILSTARLEGMIPWEAMEDRSRSLMSNLGWLNRKWFENRSMESFLTGYKRAKMQSQDTYIEVWIEKDALSGIVNRVAEIYNVPVVVARGFASMSFKNDYRTRLEKDGRPGKILYFGDFDPSGMEMLTSMMDTFEEKMYLDVEGIRCALTEDQIDEYSLPNDPSALKMTDSRAQKFLDEYGRKAVELDALPPEILSLEVETAIENNIDYDLYEEEIEKETEDQESLAKKRKKIMKLIDAK